MTVCSGGMATTVSVRRSSKRVDYLPVFPTGAMVAEAVTATTPFAVADATLARNALVTIDLTFERRGDRLRLQHTAQVRNVP